MADVNIEVKTSLTEAPKCFHSFALAKTTSAKWLEQLVGRFKEHEYESAEDFRGMMEEELTG